IASGGTYNLAGGASQVVTVRFTPTAAGAASGSAVFGNSGGNPVTAALSGNGQGSAGLSVTPSTHDFGSVAVGGFQRRLFTVPNPGGGSVPGSATPTPPFSIVSGGSYNLSSGGTQAVTVRFPPTAAGPASGTVTFSASSGGNRAASLTGTGSTGNVTLTVS